MSFSSLLLENALLVLGCMTLLWGVSVVKRNASIVDPFWSMGFFLILLNTLRHAELNSGSILLLSCVALWSLRLSGYLLWRAIGKPEDPRYQAFRQRFGPERYWWISFFQVFVLQGFLMWMISMPLQVGGFVGASPSIGWNDVLGALLFVVGFFFEAVGDKQLADFRADPSRKGTVLDTGLWRYTRHPNYFGEAVLWWGFWLMALDAPGGLATVYAPALMTFLLLRVSGVTMLEAHMKKTRPAYAAYLQRTSAFFPRPPRSIDSTSAV